MDKDQTKNSIQKLKNYFKKEFLDKFTNYYGTKNGLQLRKVEMKVISKDVRCKVQKLSIGNPSPHHPTKVILLVGATGSGKTTLINAMVNFIFRVDFHDDFRLILIDDEDAPARDQSESQTDLITAYAFNHMPGMPFDYNYVLIDTPGFGDTGGIPRDEEFKNQLESFLKKEEYGIDQVDCVGFVIPASDGKLTPTQHYVLHGLTSMFGKDLKDNICIMVTFSSTEDVEPPVLAALKKADVPYKGVFKFNNSSVYAKPAGPVSEYFWNYSNDSLQEFLYNLGKSRPVSLTLTKEVLKKRRQLQGIVIDLHNCIQFGLSLLANLHQERELLSKVTEDIGRCASYVEEVDVPRINKIKINTKTYEKTTNNEKFGLNCNLNFKPALNFKEMIASANIGLGVGYESNNTTEKTREQEITYEITYVKEKRTVPELFNRYKILQNSVKSKEAIIKRIEEEIDFFATEVISAIKCAQQHVNNLEKIALKPNQTSTIEYIEILIESEEMRRETNFLKRNEILELMKRKLQFLRV